jgi:hypothetical protein
VRELLNRDVQHRVKGRPVLERRLMGLLVAVHRFGNHRATSRDDLTWCARTIDGLTATLEAARGPVECHKPDSRTDSEAMR